MGQAFSVERRDHVGDILALIVGWQADPDFGHNLIIPADRTQVVVHESFR